MNSEKDLEHAAFKSAWMFSGVELEDLALRTNCDFFKSRGRPW